MIDSIYKKDRNYYPQDFLEKFIDVYTILGKKMSNFNDDIKIHFDDSYNVDSDEENSDGKIRMKKVKCKNLLLGKKNMINLFLKK